MSVRLELHPEADDEVNSAVDWYEEQRPGLGAEFFMELRHDLGVIVSARAHGRSGQAPERERWGSIASS